MKRFALLNLSSDPNVGVTLPLVARALSAQLFFDVSGPWGMMPMTVEVVSEEPADADSITITLFDDSDQAGVLGWHDESPAGRPYGRVFVKDSGPGLPGVISHEVIEAYLDPACNYWADDGLGRLYALEGCDPVEDRSYPITLTKDDGTTTSILVSDFIYPSWLDPHGQPPYDKMDIIKAPFIIDEGGYALYRDGMGVHQVFGAKHQPKRSKLHPSARTFKRIHRQ